MRFATALSAILLVAIVDTVHGVVPINRCLTGNRCVAGLTVVSFANCDLNDNDWADVGACLDSVGRGNIETLFLNRNDFTTVPADIFTGMDSLRVLRLHRNDLDTIAEGAFDGLGDLRRLTLQNNDLTTLPDGIFDDLDDLRALRIQNNDLVSLNRGVFDRLNDLRTVDLSDNDLTSLPADLFASGRSLRRVVLTGNTALQCVPNVPNGVTPGVDNGAESGTCGCDLDRTCASDEVCIEGASGYTCENSGGTGDPHMVGISGQKFDFTGHDGAWYSLLKDEEAEINMRVTAPIAGLDVITYITGFAVVVPDVNDKEHTMVITVEDPHQLDAECPAGTSPCLGNGALEILLDGERIVSPSEVYLGPGVSFGAVNLPGQCRPFGFEKYWERKVHEAQTEANAGRRLVDATAVPMTEWILSDALATNKPECQSWVEDGTQDIFKHQAEHVSFQLTTPTFTVRLNYGKLHQVAMRDPTDRFDLPDHITHQMNIGLSKMALGESPQGILGETTRVHLDANGEPIMTGMGAIPGIESDYEVEGPLGTSFSQAGR